MPKIRYILIGALMLIHAGCITTGDELGHKDSSVAANANMQLCIRAMQNGNLAEAKEKIDKALSQDSRNADVNYVAGILYARIKEYSKADSYYSRAISLADNSSDYANGYAAYLCGRKNFDKGESVALKAAQNPLYKTPEVAFLNAGLCALDGEHFSNAENYFRQALKAKAEFPPALINLAALQLRSGNLMSARAFVDRYHQQAPASAKSLLLGYRVEHGLGNDAVARNYAKRLRDDYATSDEVRELDELDQK